MFRVHRVSQALDERRARFVLRAVPVGITDARLTTETTRDLDAESLRDRIRLRQVVATPEQMFEQLWQQLRLDLDSL